MIGLKGIGGHAILPFLELQALKCRSYRLVTPVCMFGDLLVAILRLSSGNKCLFHYYSHPHGKLLKETNFEKSIILCTDTTVVNGCALEKAGITLHRTHTDPQKL